MFTYAEVGATRHRPLPRNYNHLRYRLRIGAGPAVFATAARLVTTFELHRRSGARITTDAAAAAVGARVTVGLGPFTGPCEVVYMVGEPNRAGFGYGSLPGHQVKGEEAFLVERDADDQVWFTVVAFSRPVRWPAIVGGPAAVAVQHAYARVLAHRLARLSRTVES